MHVSVFGSAVRAVMDVPLLHRHVALVIEDDDQDRGIVLLGGPQRLDPRVVEEAAVADEQCHRTLLRGELDAKRRAKALTEAAKAAEEALRRCEGQVLA